MATQRFVYTALDVQGQEVSGIEEAGSDTEVIERLRSANLYPTSVVPESQAASASAAPSKTRSKAPKRQPKTPKKKSGGGKIKSKQLMIFTRQLAVLLESGLPLLNGLTVLGKQEPDKVLKGTITSLSDGVQTGSTFSESLSLHPRIFNKLYVNMVKAGELGGVLELVLTRLADYQEKAQKLKNKIVGAMAYPVIVMFIAVAIMGFLLVFIVPKFEEIFEDMLGSRDKLPWLTKAVVSFSEGIVSPVGLGVIAGIILLGILFRAWAATKAGRYFVDSLILKMPLFGNLQRKSAISRFSRTLGTLVTSGVPILQSLNITRETAGNVVIAEAVNKIHDAVKEGESIVPPMEASRVFPAMVISMVEVGEETGQLPDMLLRVADVYDDEVDNAVSALTSILEPVMIVFLAVVVGTIVMALFLPLIEVIKGMNAAV